ELLAPCPGLKLKSGHRAFKAFNERAPDTLIDLIGSENNVASRRSLFRNLLIPCMNDIDRLQAIAGWAKSNQNFRPFHIKYQYLLFISEMPDSDFTFIRRNSKREHSIAIAQRSLVRSNYLDRRSSNSLLFLIYNFTMNPIPCPDIYRSGKQQTYNNNCFHNQSM